MFPFKLTGSFVRCLLGFIVTDGTVNVFIFIETTSAIESLILVVVQIDTHQVFLGPTEAGASGWFKKGCINGVTCGRGGGGFCRYTF